MNRYGCGAGFRGIVVSDLQAAGFDWGRGAEVGCRAGWAAGGQSAEVIFPPQVTEVCNSLPETYGWGIPETRFGWKEAVKPNGDHARIDQIGSPSQHQARKFFVNGKFQ